MALTLWGRASSVNVQKVLWALSEYRLDYDHRPVGGRFGGLDDPEFACLTPAKKIPVLQDGERGVWESHAILRHIARSWPRHPVSATLAESDPWMEFGTSTFQPPFVGVFWQLVRMPAPERSDAALACQMTELAAALSVIDHGLGWHGWLSGERFGLADIALGTPMHRLTDLAPELVEPVPHVRDWVERLSERHGWRTHVAVGYEELRAT